MPDSVRDPADPRPSAIGWFKLYSGALCATYLALSAFSLVLLFGNPKEMDLSPEGALLMGLMFLAVGLPLFAACLVPLLAPPRPWVWTYDLVIICLGMTSACCLPVCIPLLIHWIKPEVKRHFGRE